MSNSLLHDRNLAVCIGYHPSGWYPFLVVGDTVAENLIIPHRVDIASLRKLRGLSQEKLAEKAGVSRSLISEIEAVT